MVKPELVEVEWWDSCTTHGWERVEDFREDPQPTLCRTVGYRVFRTPGAINLFQTLRDDLSRATEMMTIPRGCVKRVRRLK